MRRCTRAVGALTILLGSAFAAQASLVAEWDFRTNQNLSAVVSGASAGAALQGSATVNTGAAIGGSYAPKVANGYLNVPTNSGSGVVSTGKWNDFMGAGWGNGGAVYVVLKPNYASGSGLHYFFYTGQDSYDVQWNTLYLFDNSGTPRITYVQQDADGANRAQVATDSKIARRMRGRMSDQR